MTRLSRRLQNSAIFLRAPGGIGRSQRHSRMSGWMPSAEQFLHRMLGRLGLEFAGRGDARHQGQVHEHHPLAPEFVAELADRFEERQAFDVADRAADLAQDEILVVEIGLDEFLDRVGDVRDHLHRRAEIFAAALAADHGRIDAAGGDAVAAPRGDADIALVMAEIEIGLGAVVGDVDLAVLIGAHRARDRR